VKDLGLLESALATFAREAMSVDADGFVTVEFDSGASTSIGRLALARFANEDELKMDDTLGGWRETPGKGPPQFGNARSPGRGGLEWAAE